MRGRVGTAAMGEPSAPRWVLDESRWPIVLFDVDTPGTDAPPDLDSLLALFDELTRRRKRIVVVIDLTHARPDAARRRRVLDWAKAHWASLRSDVIALAAVTPSAMQRAVVTGLLWFQSPPYPVQLFEHRAEALAWAEQQLPRR